jgi:hypothetical protein
LANSDRSLYAVLPRWLDQALASASQQFRVGGQGDRLRLHGDVDDHPGEVGRFGSAAAGGEVQALLQRGNQLFLPMRWRQRVIEDRSNGSEWQKKSSPQSG